MTYNYLTLTPLARQNMQPLDGTTGFNCRPVTFISQLPSFQVTLENPVADAKPNPALSDAFDQEYNSAGAHWTADTSNNYINNAASNADLEFGSKVSNPYWLG